MWVKGDRLSDRATLGEAESTLFLVLSCCLGIKAVASPALVQHAPVDVSR